jgi:hypothetical protein
VKQTLRVEIDKHGEETKVLMLETEEGDSYEELIRYLQVPLLELLIWNWEQDVLRKICKYGSEEDQKTTWEQVREKWYELKADSGVFVCDL